MGGLEGKAAVVTGAERGNGRVMAKPSKGAQLLTRYSLTPDGGYAIDSAH